jgi:hypothetical protein
MNRKNEPYEIDTFLKDLNPFSNEEMNAIERRHADTKIRRKLHRIDRHKR